MPSQPDPADPLARQQGARSASHWPLAFIVLGGVTAVAFLVGLLGRSDGDESLVVIGPRLPEDSIQTQRRALSPREPIAAPISSRPLPNEPDARTSTRAFEPIVIAEALPRPRSALPQIPPLAVVSEPSPSGEQAPAPDAGTRGAATAETAPPPAAPLRGTNNAPIFD